MKIRIKNNTELNVLAVALDHMEEHLMDISDEFDVKNRLKAVRDLQTRIVEDKISEQL